MYDKLDHFTFGTNLLETGDLDPVYIGLDKLNLSPGQLAAWLVSYWCFYHAGVSCMLAEKTTWDSYWEFMSQIATMKAAPRGIERRYFRGEKAGKAVEYLRNRYGNPIDILEDLSNGEHSFSYVSNRVQEWPLFGPWIAFKIADMLERCAGVGISFDDCELQMYKEPTEGALLIAKQEGWYPDVTKICTTLIERYQPRRAPPSFNRPVGLQEIETILCKYKSHWNGHYPVGKDTEELKKILDSRWGELASRMNSYV